MRPVVMGTLHHLELWVPDLSRAEHTWGWLLGALGYELYQQWPEGCSFRTGDMYIVLEQSQARSAFRHDRCRPGLNHLAFHVSDRTTVDRMVGEALLHGWRLMFADRHPYAGGEEHYAAYLEDSDGYEVELVAPPPAY
jgi:catechol 2,3-dioxygenase-like lactoylglutathione lyase family enzyme